MLRASSHINDSHCLTQCPKRLLAGNNVKEQTLNSLTVNLSVVKLATSVPGHSQKKGVSPGATDCHCAKQELKYVNSVSCVTQLSCAPLVTNVRNVVSNTPVGARLQSFWKIWLDLGASPRVIQILKQGYTLPFRIRPHLSRSPTVVSCYVNPHRNSYLLEALHQLMVKNAVEVVHNQNSLGFFNRLFLVPKPNSQWRPILDLSKLNLFSQSGEIQNGNTGNHQNIPPARGVGHLSGLQGCLLPYSDTEPVQEISQIPCPRSDLSIQSVAFRTVHSTHGIHYFSQGGETDGHAQGYKDPPVPGRLVGKSQFIPCLSPAYADSSTNVSRTRLAGKHRKIGTGTQASLQLRRLPVRSQDRPGPTDPGPVGKPPRQNSDTFVTTGLSGPAIHVSDRPVDGHRKTGSFRPSAHEAHSVAPQKPLEGTGISRKDYPSAQVPAPTLAMVATGGQCSPRPTFTPHKACSADLYRRIKRRMGRSLKRAHCKRVLVGTGKQTAHQLPRTKGSLASFKGVSGSLRGRDRPSSYRQHHSGSVHKQGGGHEVGPPVCPPLEDIDLVLPETGDSQSPTYSRPSKCDSRQAIQARSDYPNRVVPPSGGLSRNMQQVAPAPRRSVCHEVQSQTASICIPSSGLPSFCSRCSHSAMGGSGCICLSTNPHIGQGGGEVIELSMQETNPHCTRVAQHALVLGPGEHVQSGPPQTSQSVDTALQSDPSQKSDKPEPSCMAPRASAIRKQGFSEAVATRIEAPQRRSTRSVYEAKWSIFTKWCIANQVDFKSPPLKSVADFLLYLFEVKNLQPSTIDGYRSAIADKLGNVILNVGKDENLTRLLDSFHRDRPKGRRGIPSWNLSLVLHQLTKAPFEPLREASLKHLTFKTVFLLALGSGKRRSEIHAWQHKNIRHQSDWSKVSLFPSPSFLSKNQLAKEGPESVAPVVIPALAPTLDRSLKSDKSLCPVRALRYYLDRTSGMRQDKDLVFVSFKKGFDKDISPATISSWIKQTVILCYELSDHRAHTLHQVKAHDVRAFAASKAFQSGVSLEQILSACHWKSHNTFTQFYLKDVAWADSELYHLGPVVAAQQVHKQASL